MSGGSVGSVDSSFGGGGEHVKASELMSAAGYRSVSDKGAILARRLAVPAAIFGLVLLVYFTAFPHPRVGTDQELKHFVFLAESFLSGRVDVSQIPDYPDLVFTHTGMYLYAPPAPAFFLVPVVAVWGTGFSQAYFGMALGAANAVLLWYLLGLINVSRTTKLLLVPFFAFGTVHFSAAAIGSVWFYAHVAAVFFLFVAIISQLRWRSAFLPGVFLGLAFLSRGPTILAAPFFLYLLLRQRHRSLLSREALLDKQSLIRIGRFCAGLAPFVVFALWYNYARFGDIFDSGNEALRGYNIHGSPADIYSFYRPMFPDAPHFNLLDVRNVPLHLYTVFLMPPEFHPDWSILRPSQYGMAVLLTSPAFIYAGLVKRDDPLKLACWMAIGLVSIPLVLHYSQGWVQFGYRFLLDFAPFLLILTALGFEDHQSPSATRMKVFLVGVSILAGFWGQYWISELGWGH